MDPALQSGNVLRFGAFELDPCSGELRKSGVKIRTPDQAIKILHSLLKRPGEVVTREELAHVLWPDGTNVDFESGLNAAVKKLRIALGDSGASPRYIETLPRRGYRMIVPVSSPTAASRLAPAADESPGRSFRPRLPAIRVALVVLALTAGSLVAFWARRELAAPRVLPVWDSGRLSENAEANGYFAKAQLFMGSGLLDPGRASDLLGRALQLDPRFGKARAEYGFVHLIMINTGRSNDRSLLYKAEEQIRQGLRDDPTFSHGHTALAALYLHDGRKERAPAEIETALKINPYDIDAKHWLAVYHNLSGDSFTAQTLEKEILARNQRFFPGQMYLGELARQHGDLEEAIRHHGKLLEYDPENIYALQFLARTYMDKSDFSNARLTLDRLRPVARASFTTRAIEAMLLAMEKRYDEAAKAMDREVLNYMELTALWTLAGAEFFALMGDRARAIEWLERAVRQGDERAAWFARDPSLKAIWGEPHFQQIVASIAARRTSVSPLSQSGSASPATSDFK